MKILNALKLKHYTFFLLSEFIFEFIQEPNSLPVSNVNLFHRSGCHMHYWKTGFVHVTNTHTNTLIGQTPSRTVIDLMDHHAFVHSVLLSSIFIRDPDYDV